MSHKQKSYGAEETLLYYNFKDKNSTRLKNQSHRSFDFTNYKSIKSLDLLYQDLYRYSSNDQSYSLEDQQIWWRQHWNQNFWPLSPIACSNQADCQCSWHRHAAWLLTRDKNLTINDLELSFWQNPDFIYSPSIINNKVISLSFDAYFDYFFTLFLELNNCNIKASYFSVFKKQVKKCLKKLFQFNPKLLHEEQTWHTFKKPHTSSLTKWRREIHDYLRNYFTEYLQLYRKLVIFREFHKCHVECHYIEVESKLLPGEIIKIHKKNAYCSCKDENNQALNHRCRHDIHLMILTDSALDFSSWEQQGHGGYYKEIVDPNQLCETDYGGDEDFALLHPDTKEPVNEMTKVLCYINKAVEGRFQNPQLYLDHDDNPTDDYFDVYDYAQDKSYQKWKVNYNQQYYRNNKEKIKQCLSNHSKLNCLDVAIWRLEQKIAKSRAEETVELRAKRTQLTVKRSRLKLELIAQSSNKNNVLVTTLLNTCAGTGESKIPYSQAGLRVFHTVLSTPNKYPNIQPNKNTIDLTSPWINSSFNRNLVKSDPSPPI